MRAVFAILLFVLCGSLLAARADVIVSGSVSTVGAQGLNCSDSGTSASNLSLACNGTQPASYATVSGHGDAYSGNLALDVGMLEETPPVGIARGSVELGLNQTYILTGGTGTATVDFLVDQPYVFPSTSMSCDFTFNGASQPCDLRAGMLDFAETVEYGVPFSIGLDLGINGVAFNGAPEDGAISYSVSQPGLWATPEPTSVLLLLPGLAGVWLAARSRSNILSKRLG